MFPSLEFLPLLNNREEAVVAWLAIALVLAVVNSNVRSAISSVIKAFLAPPIVFAWSCMAVYVGVVVLLLYFIGYWDLSLMKDTVTWFGGPAMVLFVSQGKAHEDPDYFKKTLIKLLSLTVIVEFAVNLYVFSFWIEMFLVPLSVALGALLAVSTTKPEYEPSKHLFQSALNVLGLVILGYTVVMIAVHFSSFATQDTLREFILPATLTIAFIPFIYVLALYSGYEDIFVRVGIWITDRELAGYTRRRILLACGLSLGRVRMFMHEYTRKLPTVRSKGDAKRLVSEFEVTAETSPARGFTTPPSP